MKEGKKLIVVLGMHRSGTSVMTRGLEVLNIELGDNLQAGMENVNKKGFFEDNDIVSLNEELLGRLESTWSLQCEINWRHIDNVVYEDLQSKASSLLAEKLQNIASFAIKDPRVSILLPFWQPVFKELEIEVKYLIAIRNPLSVAASLSRRDNFPMRKSINLWLKYTVAALHSTKYQDRLIVDYDKLMKSPRDELDRISKAFRTETGYSEEKLEDFESDFLEENLRSTHFIFQDLLENPSIPSFVTELYEILLRYSHDEPVEGVLEKYLDSLEDRLSQMQDDLAYWDQIDKQHLNEVQELNTKVNELSLYSRRVEQTVCDLQNKNASVLFQLTRSDEELLKVKSENVSLKEHQINLQNELVNNLRRTHEGYQQSTSWKVTQPLRVLSGLFQGGKNIAESEIKADEVEEPLTVCKFVPLSLIDSEKHSVLADINLAVHVHVTDLSFVSELVIYLNNIPIDFSLYITVDRKEKEEQIRGYFSTIKRSKHLEICSVAYNDLAMTSLIAHFSEQLSNYDVVLPIHLPTIHNTEQAGLRRYLLESFMGSSTIVTSVLNQFTEEKKSGVLYPPLFRPVRQTFNNDDYKADMSKLLSLFRQGKIEIDQVDFSNFPTTSMYWLKGELVGPLSNFQISAEESGVELEKLECGLAMLIPQIAFEKNLIVNTYTINSFLREHELGTAPLNLLAEYSNRGLIKDAIIFFDHNLGGGTNVYTRSFLEETLLLKKTVIRVYFQDYNWFVEWISFDDGLVFSTTDLAELFERLKSLDLSSIIINSLYGISKVALSLVISEIIKLSQSKAIPLDFKVHDYYSICPSPHLQDMDNKYCGVPEDSRVCDSCLQQNTFFDPAELLTKKVDDWREPFKRLIDEATCLTVFNASSIEVLKRAYLIDEEKVKVIPHNDHYFKLTQSVKVKEPMHIASIGTLTPTKGSEVINKLSGYILDNNLDTPITIVGDSGTVMAPEITVLGPYEVGDLPRLLQNEGVNVIFIASIIPETFSYTVSEAIKMELPIVAFELGAQGERVAQYRFGKVVPLNSSPEIIYSALQHVLTLKLSL